MPGLALVHDYLLVLRGRRAHLRRDGRRLAGRADRDAALRRGGHARAASPAATITDLAAAAPRRAPARTSGRCCPLFPTAARRLDAERLRPHHLEQQRLRPRRAQPRGRAPRLLLPLAVSLRLARAGAGAVRGARAAAAAAARLLLRRHRRFDRRAARAWTSYVANGRITQERIKRFWGRDAEIVHPPVDVERFHIGEPGDHVLFVGELVRHKRPELAIEAAAAAGRRIKVVGAGPSSSGCSARYGAEAEFLGRVGRRAARRASTPRPRRWSCRTSRSSGSPPSRRRPPAAR